MAVSLVACSKSSPPASSQLPAGSPTPAASLTEDSDEVAAAKANPIVLKAAVKSSSTAANAVAVQHWCDAVNNADIGITMEFYPDGQLGTETELIQQILLGEPIISNADASNLQPYAPQLSITSGPYFVETLDDLQYVIETEWFQEQMDLLESQGLKIVDPNMRFGQRNFLATKAISSPADLKGMKIRSMTDEASMAIISAMGGTPVPLPFSEIFEGLNNGIVEGEENPLNTIFVNKHYDTPAKVISPTGHQSTFTFHTMATSVWNKLTPYQQKVLTECAAAAMKEYNEVLYPAATQDALDQFEAVGVTINDNVDIAAFKEATLSVYDIIDPDGVYDTIQAQMAEIKAAASK